MKQVAKLISNYRGKDELKIKGTNALIQMIAELNAESGTIRKKEILKSYLVDNECGAILQAMFRLALSPYIIFGVKAVKIPKESNEVSSKINIVEFFILCQRLANRALTGNEAKDAINEFLLKCCKDEQIIFANIIKKKMVNGVAAKLVNAVVPNLIPEYGCQLATGLDYDNLNLKDIKGDFIVQPKIDGFRCQAFIYNNRVELYTRSGKRLEGYTGIENDLIKLVQNNSAFVNHVLDGEITNQATLDWIDNNIKDNIDASQEQSRTEFQNTMKYAMAKIINKDGVLNVFDVVGLDAWINHSETYSYKQRYDILKYYSNSLFNTINNLGLKYLKCVESVVINNDYQNELLKHLDRYTKQGWEGVIIRPLDSQYEWKRGKSLFKLKKMKDIDLKVIRIENGTGKFADTLGAVIVDYDGFEVGVGSGFTDEQREYYYNNQNEIIGKTIEIRYQAETVDQNGNKSLSFPVFQCVRVDK